MKYKQKEKRISVALTEKHYELLKELAEFEGRFISRQGSRLIKSALDEYEKKKVKH